MQKNTDLLEMIEINPKIKPIATIIWMHGLGADGNDFVPIVPELNLPTHLPIRFVFPNAPMQPVSINNGYIMRSWYDIVALDVHKHADEKGIAVSVEQIQRIIQHEEQRGIPSENIILAGFSQGCVIALTTGLTYQKRLGGIIALSGYLPFAESVIAKTNNINSQIPIFLAHGSEDNVVPYFLGEKAHEILIKHHYPIEWHSYPMAHSVCMEEITAISEWIQRVTNK